MPADWEQKVLSARRMSIASATLTDDSSVDVGGDVQIDIVPAAGTIARLYSLYLHSGQPSLDGATSGTHNLLVSSVLQATADYNVNLYRKKAQWQGATTEEPDDEVLALMLVQAIRFTSDAPLPIWWENDTDAAISRERRVSAKWIEEEVYSA